MERMDAISDGDTPSGDENSNLNDSAMSITSITSMSGLPNDIRSEIQSYADVHGITEQEALAAPNLAEGYNRAAFKSTSYDCKHDGVSIKEMNQQIKSKHDRTDISVTHLLGKANRMIGIAYHGVQLSLRSIFEFLRAGGKL